MLLIGRNVTEKKHIRYQMLHEPIPLSDVELTSIPDFGDSKYLLL
jgi:hypothetical protein